jgi:hypothetical protein
MGEHPAIRRLEASSGRRCAAAKNENYDADAHTREMKS